MARTQSSFNTDQTEEQKSMASSSSASSTVLSPFYYQNEFYHDEEAPGEVMSLTRLPDTDLIILDYLNGDLNVYPDDKENEASKPFTQQERQQFMLFGRPIQKLPHPDASRMATLILSAEEKMIEEAMSLAKMNPTLLSRQARAIDRLGRVVEGTPLQIAWMAGDIDMINKVTKQKACGVAERLITVSGLSQHIVEKQKEVITSKEAIQKNSERNNRYLDAIKKFGEGLIEKSKAYKRNGSGDHGNFILFQSLCQPLIDQLEKDLASISDEVISSGYIFDPAILREAGKWFEANIKRFVSFHTVHSDVFWVNGFGKLQSKLSSRDLQFAKIGIGAWLEKGEIPERRALPHSAKLGRDIYYGCYGHEAGSAVYAETGSAMRWKFYVEQKQQPGEMYTVSEQFKTESVLSPALK